MTPETEARLQGIRLKDGRASYHLDQLGRDVSWFLYRNPYEFVSELSADQQSLFLKFQLTENPLAFWATLVGDVIHNLRSALEHLAWQIVDANGGATGRDIKFPIYGCKRDYDGWRAPTSRRRDPFSGVDARAIKAIEDEQPYSRKDGEDPAEHPLAVINRLWNRDKHEVLIPAIFGFPELAGGPIIVTPMFMWHVEDFEAAEATDQPPGEFADALFARGGRLNDGERLITVKGKVTGPEPKVEMQGKIGFEVCLDDGRPLVASLYHYRDYVRGVIERLVDFL